MPRFAGSEVRRGMAPQYRMPANVERYLSVNARVGLQTQTDQGIIARGDAEELLGILCVLGSLFGRSLICLVADLHLLSSLPRTRRRASRERRARHSQTSASPRLCGSPIPDKTSSFQHRDI